MTNIASNFKPTPYWWEAAPPGTGTREAPEANYDALIIGSGVTGLSAALALAEAGRKVVVCDADTIGFGASSRNNGSIVPFGFLHQEQLEKKFGAERGAAIAKDQVSAFNHLLANPARYGFDPIIKSYDRYFLALTEKHRQHLAHDAELQAKRGVGLVWTPISNDELMKRTGLKGFHGGLHIPNSMAMHPGLYTQGLVKACVNAGVDLVGNCRVLKIERKDGHSIVHTRRGQVKARNVVAATNGYTGPENPQLQKRIYSARLYMAATEPVPADLMAKFFPDNRQFADSRLSMRWIRPSPDGTRLLIGGRGGMGGDDPEKHAETLHADMVDMIPQLAPLKLTHCWYGYIGFPHDFIPHIGEMDGIHYSAGYCGVGMCMGSYMGTRLGHKILGSDPSLSATAMDSIRFPTIPLSPIRDFYTRLGVAWFNIRDWWDVRSR